MTTCNTNRLQLSIFVPSTNCNGGNISNIKSENHQDIFAPLFTVINFYTLDQTLNNMIYKPTIPIFSSIFLI